MFIHIERIYGIYRNGHKIFFILPYIKVDFISIQYFDIQCSSTAQQLLTQCPLLRLLVFVHMIDAKQKSVVFIQV